MQFQANRHRRNFRLVLQCLYRCELKNSFMQFMHVDWCASRSSRLTQVCASSGSGLYAESKSTTPPFALATSSGLLQQGSLISLTHTHQHARFRMHTSLVGEHEIEGECGVGSNQTTSQSVLCQLLDSITKGPRLEEALLSS